MQSYVLFKTEELDSMIHGEEIIHKFVNGKNLFFMCEDHHACSIENPVFTTRGEAEEILRQLREIHNGYGVVQLSDLHDILGLSSNYISTKYGWITLKDVEIIIRDSGECGYELKLPRALPIV